jgi:hypothetical protein
VAGLERGADDVPARSPAGDRDSRGQLALGL